MQQTKYFLAVPKNLGLGLNFRPCSEGYFLSGRPQSVDKLKLAEFANGSPSLEQLPPLNSFCGNFSIYEVKNCHNVEIIEKFHIFQFQKRNCFCGNYSQNKVYTLQHDLTFVAHSCTACQMEIFAQEFEPASYFCD